MFVLGTNIIAEPLWLFLLLHNYMDFVGMFLKSSRADFFNNLEY